jgi:hypothetical protein
MSNLRDRRSYSLAASGDAQANFNSVAARLEALISQRDADVRAAMADYVAAGVSDEYAGKEQRWHVVAEQVGSIITALRTNMSQNDGSAQQSMSRAGAAVAGIG